MDFEDTNFSKVVFLGTNPIICDYTIGLPEGIIVNVPNNYVKKDFCSYEIYFDPKNNENKKKIVYRCNSWYCVWNFGIFDMFNNCNYFHY